jgi:hypothetical protein
MVARAIFAVVLGLSSSALAQATLIDGFGGPADFGGDCLSPNDDSSSAPIDLTPAFPGGLEFFGTTYDTVWVNTNGNITFNAGLGDYTPDPFPIAEQPMIAPYWSDVDIRGEECGGFSGSEGCMNGGEDNGVWWHLERGRMIVTWDRVGHFGCNDAEKMSFQLILQEPQYCGGGTDFDVEFRYNRCEWEAGDASGDEDGDGLCTAGETSCIPAQVGFDAGNERDFVSLPGSLMSGIRTIVCTESNIGVPGVYRFAIRGGNVECPDANRPCDTGGVGVCGEGRSQCMGLTPVCRTVHEPSAERCDGLDNDCNGDTDEGMDLCEGDRVCVRGRCIDRCTEFGCPEGQTCNMDLGSCTEDACDGISCRPGERCIGGECRSVCEDIVCPAGRICSGGQCVDGCVNAECGTCYTCVDGACLLHCAIVGCSRGFACEETGECVEEDCLGVRCGPGRTCRAGRCANSCAGAICPRNEHCEMGECVPGAPVMPDAGMPDPDVDAGRFDAGNDSTPDSGPSGRDAGVMLADAGMEEMDGGCGCRALGSSGSSGQGSSEPRYALLAIAALFFLRRRGRS